MCKSMGDLELYDLYSYDGIVIVGIVQLSKSFIDIVAVVTSVRTFPRLDVSPMGRLSDGDISVLTCTCSCRTRSSA